jgi:hypothetical protein
VDITRGIGHSGKIMGDQPFYPLENPEREWIADARTWVKGHFSNDAEAAYEPISGKLGVIAAILENGWVAADETDKLQALGIAFGDAIAQKLMLDWVTVNDEYGRTPALNWPGTSIVSFPVTMIAKRVEDGEPVDVHQLFDGICAQLNDMAFGGRAV